MAVEVWKSLSDYMHLQNLKKWHCAFRWHNTSWCLATKHPKVVYTSYLLWGLTLHKTQMFVYYCKISNIRCIKSLKCFSSCSCLCAIYWSQLLSREWRCSWSTSPKHHQAICTISSSYVNSNWSYSPETVKLGVDLCDLDLWPWPFAWTSLLSLVITPENFMMIRWWEHGEKDVTDGQTDGRTSVLHIWYKYQVKLDAPHSAPTYLCSHLLAVIFLDRKFPSIPVDCLQYSWSSENTTDLPISQLIFQ